LTGGQLRYGEELVDGFDKLPATGSMARELGPRNITVNLVQPRPIKTDLRSADGD
jgi:hypothetical protein